MTRVGFVRRVPDKTMPARGQRALEQQNGPRSSDGHNIGGDRSEPPTHQEGTQSAPYPPTRLYGSGI
jgi:hypothetical protein